jgi:hypothetical protein
MTLGEACDEGDKILLLCIHLCVGKIPHSFIIVAQHVLQTEYEQDLVRLYAIMKKECQA